MSRPTRRTLGRIVSAICLVVLPLGLAACLTGAPGGSSGGFGIDAAALRPAPAESDSETKIPASGRGESPLQIAGVAMVPDGGVGSFGGFRSGFLSAVEDGRTMDYLDRIRFPLTLIDHRRPNGNGRSVNPNDFTSRLIYDAETLRARDIEPVPLGDTFTGPGSEALYWGDRLLVFRPVDGRWMLTEAGSCESRSCRPADLLCRGDDRRRAFPGRTPHGYEDFQAFYRAFYCLSDEALDPAASGPSGALIGSRIRFPLYGVRPDPDSESAAAREVTQDDFQPDLLFSATRAVPSISVEGTGARAVVGVGADDQVTAMFTRIDGLWYLTGLDTGNR